MKALSKKLPVQKCLSCKGVALEAAGTAKLSRLSYLVKL